MWQKKYREMTRFYRSKALKADIVYTAEQRSTRGTLYLTIDITVPTIASVSMAACSNYGRLTLADLEQSFAVP